MDLKEQKARAERKTSPTRVSGRIETTTLGGNAALACSNRQRAILCRFPNLISNSQFGHYSKSHVFNNGTASRRGAACYGIDTIRQKLYEKTPSAVNKICGRLRKPRSRNGRRPTQKSMA